MQIIKRTAAALLGLALVACGGGGGSAGTPPFGDGGSGGGTVPVSSVEVVSSSPQVGTAGERVEITAIVRGDGNVTLANVPVTFASTTGSLSAVDATTDASGVATAQFSSGPDKSLRSADITVTASDKSGTVSVDIAGTTLVASGRSTLQFNEAASLSVKVTDSAGAAIGGASVSVASSLGATLSSATLTTDAQGVATVTYTADRAGSDSVQFTALGAAATPLTVVVSGEDFAFIAPAAGASLPIGSAHTVTARYLVSGAPAGAGFAVRFASTAGVVSPATAVAPGATLSGGQASASVTSSFAGPATIQATLVNAATGVVLAQATLPVQFVATSPSAIVLQITPTAIGPNTAGSTARQAQVRATVRDVSGNPVQGAIVNFSKDADPSGGNLSQASAATDSNGQASVQFIAGATTTAADAVVLRGTVAGTSVTDTETMTVNQSALFIGLGTGNEISNAPGTNNTAYLKVWTAYVTDSSGAAVPNQTLTISVLPTRYRIGSYTLTEDGWAYGAVHPGTIGLMPGDLIPEGLAVTCMNEDVDYSGFLAGKDDNGNGRLDPGNVISVNGGPSVVTVTTDAQGFALLNLVYAESYASWVEVELKATATVAGTESSNSATFWVRGMKSDFSEDGGPPAGVVSPFGENYGLAGPPAKTCRLSPTP
jgi:hypothetical protein